MSLFDPSVQRATDANGNPLSGAKWFFYLTETTTPTNCYSDSGLTSSLGSSITADAGGLFNSGHGVYLNDGISTRAILKTAAGATILDIDPCNGAVLSGGAAGPLAALTPAANKIAYYTSASAAALTDYTSFARELDAASTASEAREILGTDTAMNARTASLAPYLGPVANNCRYPTWVTGNGTSTPRFRSRSSHYAVQDINQMRLFFVNGFVNLNTGDMTERYSSPVAGWTLKQLSQVVQIEYPVGVLHSIVRFSGSTTGTIAAGGTSLSDMMPVNIPAGAQFWIRRAVWNTDASTPAIVPINFWGGTDDFANHGNAVDYDLSGGTVDPLSLWSYTDNYNLFSMPPAAILGITSRRTFAMIGNSRFEGSQDLLAQSKYGDVGQIARALQGFGNINIGVGNDSFNEFLVSHTNRLTLANYCSDWILGDPTNDFGRLGRNATQAQADAEDVGALAGGRNVWFCTCPPTGVSSTDSYATTANQTVNTSLNTKRVAYNAAVRTGFSGATGYLDISDVLEDIRDNGKWKLIGGLPATADGVHELPRANVAIAESGAVPFVPTWIVKQSVLPVPTAPMLYGAKTYDAPSVASGAQTTTTVTVTGAALGDRVSGISLGVSAAGISLSGYVSASNTVTVVLSNLSGGAIDLASTTLTVEVSKA